MDPPLSSCSSWSFHDDCPTTTVGPSATGTLQVSGRHRASLKKPNRLPPLYQPLYPTFEKLSGCRSPLSLSLSLSRLFNLCRAHCAINSDICPRAQRTARSYSPRANERSKTRLGKTMEKHDGGHGSPVERTFF